MGSTRSRKSASPFPYADELTEVEDGSGTRLKDDPVNNRVWKDSVPILLTFCLDLGAGAPPHLDGAVGEI
jgi:hypothetical protein